ncbi:KRAB [Mytilus edulis]|uniref:KRAB n=1 Tax=Mytilus edulis TaxID=6550 RepID=A0A8S3Q9C7_MYTED|nr:KRAB [Mytilus edulis]
MKGQLLGKKHRIILPACVVNILREEFPSLDGLYEGFEECENSFQALRSSHYFSAFKCLYEKSKPARQGFTKLIKYAVRQEIKRLDLGVINLSKPLNEGTLDEFSWKPFIDASDKCIPTVFYLTTQTYICVNICKKEFKSRSGLSRHKRFFHTENQLGCGICTKTYKSRDALRRHERTVHQQKRNQSIVIDSKVPSTSRIGKTLHNNATRKKRNTSVTISVFTDGKK